ncbi:MAG: hypothetical protein KGZ50_00085 [Peptococcaceae bacterium]|nr:hypothetical protein [Peptococcaceae bacterium]
MEKELSIVGIIVNNKPEHAPTVQRVISDFGPCILGRFGIPDPSSDNGLITLVMECNAETRHQLQSRLEDLGTVSFNSMCVKRNRH